MTFCVRCNIMMDIKEYGLILVTGNRGENRMRGDMYKCPDCGIEVVADFGKKYPDPDGDFDYRPFSRT
ncbi:MAG: hypothetical protein ACFFCS_09385 [Candidatus Hodarchaeota archaeon]